jgi:hypothetical protein
MAQRAPAAGPAGQARPARSGWWRRGRKPSLRLEAFKEGFWQRKGLRVVTAITGDASEVRTVLYRAFESWPVPGEDSAHAEAGKARGGGAAGREPVSSIPPWLGGRVDWIPPTRDRVRWLPWQARTASWPAAYNTACLYAVLANQGLANEEQVVVSLRRVVSNRDSGIERPYDWISKDPDFLPLLRDPKRFPAVRLFHVSLERRDYPANQSSAPIRDGARGAG